jgi:hypothetical protein
MNYIGNESSTGVRSDAALPLARGLGWFSIALGAAEVIAPGRLAELLGMEGQERVLRAYGVREIATGIGVLAAENPAPWIWGRVAGDALDLATLARGLDEDNPNRRNVGVALAAVAGVAALDVLCGRQLTRAQEEDAAPARDYSDRSGFPRPPQEMRGVAARDFEAPRDMRTPAALRAYSATP